VFTQIEEKYGLGSRHSTHVLTRAHTKPVQFTKFAKLKTDLGTVFGHVKEMYAGYVYRFVRWQKKLEFEVPQVKFHVVLLLYFRHSAQIKCSSQVSETVEF
jgi:hypothetical protein